MTPAAWIAVTILAVLVLALLALTARLHDLLDDARRTADHWAEEADHSRRALLLLAANTNPKD